MITIPEGLDPDEHMIFVAEATECGARTEEEMQRQANRAVDLERTKRAEAGSNRIRAATGVYANRMRGVAPPTGYHDLPANAADLVRACVEAALARYERTGTITDKGNHRARWWALVALANVPAQGRAYCVRDKLGSRRATAMLGSDRGNGTTHEQSLEQYDSTGYCMAVAFGSKLMAVWS